MTNTTKSPSTTTRDGDAEAIEEPVGWVPSGTPSNKLDPADDGEIIDDTPTPWVPVILSPSVGYPTAGIALAAGLGAWALNAHRGPITATLCSILAAALIVLSVIDLRTLRLPDAIVLPLTAFMSFGVILAALVGEITAESAWIAFACLGGAWAVYWLLALITGGMGYGDVKLSAPMGLVIGLAGHFAAIMGVTLPFILGGAVSLVLIVIGKRNLAIPFGPFMAGGGLIMLMAPGVLGLVTG